MGIVIKQSIRSSIISYLGVAIGYVNVLLLYPYFLDTGQVGLFRLVQSSAYLLATFGQVGTSQSFVKFYPEYKKEKGFLTAALFGGTIGFVLLCIVTLIFKNQIVEYFSRESALFTEYFQLTLIITFLIILFQILEAYSRSILKITASTFLKDIGLRLLTMVAIVLFGFEVIGFNSLIYSLIGTFGLSLIGLFGYFWKQGDLNLSFNFSFLKSNNLKQIIQFGLYSLIGAGGTQIILQIDSIMISGALGLDETGIYTIAFFIGIVIEMPKRAINQLSSALLAQSFKKDDMEAVEKLYKQTSINQFLIGSFLLIGIYANLDNIYALIPNGESFIAGINVVLFIGLGKLSDMAFGANGQIIVMSRYYRFNVISVAILAILTIILNIQLIPNYGIEGAAIASFLAMLSFNMIKFFFIWWKFGIQPFDLSTLKLLLVTGIALGANYFLSNLPNVLIDLAIRSIMISMIFIGLVYLLKVSEEVNGLIDQGIQKLKLK